MIVSEKEAQQYRIRKGDVLFNRTNSFKFVGRTGYCDYDTHSVFASYLIRLRPQASHLLPEYLAVYLNTSIGIGQVKRRAMESINQANVSGSEIKQVPIPLFPISFQTGIAQLVHRASDKRELSRAAAAEAEALLTAALKLDTLDVTRHLFYERRYSDTRVVNRCDAEYFSPRMQNLIRALSRDGKTIGDVAKLSKRRFKPQNGVEFQYIEIGDVNANGTADSTPVLGEEAPSRAAWTVTAGDIITTTVRPIRRLSAIISADQSGNVCSSGFAVLTPRNQDTPSELLLTFLRLPLVCELLDLYTTASMYPAISTTNLLTIPISLPDVETRQRIVAKVREALKARTEAWRLLDDAKDAVERAILSGK
jgi:restriction endonuclease S subunit